MDLENIKRMSFLIVFLFLKMYLLNYDPSPCSLAGGRDKTCINKCSFLLKANVLYTQPTADWGSSWLIGSHEQ